MKYVFHDVFISSNAPKGAQEVCDLLRQSVGSEMLSGQMEKFVAMIRVKAKEANVKLKSKLVVSYRNEISRYDNRRHGQISMEAVKSYGPDSVARLHFVEVDSLWAEHNGELKQFTFSEWDRMKFRIDFEKMKGGES